MRRIIILLLALLLLTGCSNNNLEGIWKDPNGSSTITFENNEVVFFEVKGTFAVKGNVITLTLNETKIDMKYKINKNRLTIFFEDKELVFDRE